MMLAAGFVVGGRYEIRRLLHRGESWDAYLAHTDHTGPGEVVVRTLRYPDDADAATVLARRQEAARAWDALVRASQTCSSFVAVPVERVLMYPGDPAWRSHLMQLDRSLVPQEVYHVTTLVQGMSVSRYVQQPTLDDEQALLLLLRLLLAWSHVRSDGLTLRAVRASDLVVHPVSRNFVLLDHARLMDRAEVELGDTGFSDGEPTDDDARAAGRIAASLLGGTLAPSWSSSDPEELERLWNAWFDSRRIPPEYRPILHELLIADEPDDDRLEGALMRTRALTGIRPPPIWSTPSSQATSELTGQRLQDRVLVGDVFAQGGRGTLLLALDPATQAMHALKVGRYQYDSAREFAAELRQRRAEAVHEYEILRAFHNELGKVPVPLGLLRARGQGGWFQLAPELADDEPHLLMQKIPGVPLLSLLQAPRAGYGGTSPSNRLPISFVMWVVSQLSRMLQLIHASGYLLQDLKTENLLYDPEMELVYLVDLASVCPRDASGRLRRDSVAFGMQTHGFAAPEFADLWEKVDDRFDIYSLGATAYHLLTGVNPERVAVDSSQEYPVLDPKYLSGIPRVAAELVLGCLAPLEKRFVSAAAVAAAADQARLSLSRGRPLDIEPPQVRWLADRVTLQWQPPADLRVDYLRVSRLAGTSDASEEVLWEGPLRRSIDLPLETMTAPVELEIQTGLHRGETRIRSRGRRVLVEPFPAPLAFEAASDFGHHALRVALAAHATGLVIRRQMGFPPSTVDEGESVDTDTDPDAAGVEWVQHVPAPAGTVWHYAAFAMYGQRVSAPRLDSCAALESLPDVVAYAAVVDETGIRWSWQPELVGAGVEAITDDGTRLPVQVTSTSAFVAAAAADQLVNLQLTVTRSRVRSRVLAAVAARFWPTVPGWTVLSGPRVLVRVPALPPTIAAVRASWLDERPESGEEVTGERIPAAGQVWLQPPAAPSDAAWQRREVRLECELADGSLGPARTFVVWLPTAGLVVRARLEDEVEPARIRVEFPPGPADPGWVGYVLRVEHDAAAGSVEVALPYVEDTYAVSGPLGDEPSRSGVVQVSAAEAGWLVRCGALEPGVVQTLVATLVAPSGESVSAATLSWSHRVRIGPPVLKPQLGSVTLGGAHERWSGWSVDVETTVDGSHDTPEIHPDSGMEVRERIQTHLLVGCWAPLSLRVPDGATVDVRWRLSHSELEMPWSEVVRTAAWRTPDAVQVCSCTLRDDLFWFEWESNEDAQTSFELAAEDGRLVYQGAGRSARDWERSATGWTLTAVRQGVRSAGLHVPVPTLASLPAAAAAGAPTPTGAQPLVVVGEGAESVLPPDPLVQVRRVVVSRGIHVLELMLSERADQMVLAVLSEAWRPPDRLERSDAFVAKYEPLIVSVHRPTGRRGLMAWSRSTRRVWLARWWSQQPSSSVTVSGPFEVEAGEILGAAASRFSRLHLYPLSESLRRPIPLQMWTPDGETRVVMLDEVEPLQLAGSPEGGIATLPSVVLDATTVSIADTWSPTVLVPMHVTGQADQVRVAPWNDAASAVPSALVDAFAQLLGCPVASRTGRTDVVAHLLVEGRHTEVRCTLTGPLQSGRATVRWKIRAAAGGLLREQTVSIRDALLHPDRVVMPIKAAWSAAVGVKA